MSQKTKEELQSLIEKATAGEKEALETLVTGIQDMVFNLSLRMLGTFPDAEDAAQTEAYKKAEANLTENAANVYIQDLADLVAVRKGFTGVRFYPIYVLDLAGIRYTA